MSDFTGRVLGGWHAFIDGADVVLDRSRHTPTHSVHPPIDMLAALIERYPDLPERIERMRQGLSNPPIVIKSECPRCGTLIEQAMTMGSKRVYCSEKCARGGR